MDALALRHEATVRELEVGHEAELKRTGSATSPGRQRHSGAALYISLAILYTKYTGGRSNDVSVCA